MSELLNNIKIKKIVFNGHVFQHKQVLSSIEELAVYLSQNTSTDSPFVYLYATNHIKTVIAYFAIIKADLIAVLVPPDIGKLELEEMKADTPPAAEIHTDNSTTELIDQKEISFNNKSTVEIHKNELKDVCTIIYKAAEDGFAKGVMLTKENIFSNAKAIYDCDNLNENSVCCALLPFNHIYGLQTGVIAPMLYGGSLLIEDITNLTRIRTISNNLKKYGVTNLYSLPSVYYLLAKVPDIKSKLKNTITFVSGGYGLSKKIYNSFLKNTGNPIHEGYGLSETAPICTWHRPDDKVRTDSVGRAFSCCEVSIFDENYKELSPNQTGEICVRGKNVMKGYYNRPSHTKKTLRNGWFHTGDFGKIDDDGYVYITEKNELMYNVGGKTIYPAEIKRLIKLNPNVLDIEIYCEPSPLQGNILKATITLANKYSKIEFREWCLKNISRYKIPLMTEN